MKITLLAAVLVAGLATSAAVSTPARAAVVASPGTPVLVIINTGEQHPACPACWS
jgi:hypothetical protein